jgi:hypothetical protein
MALVAEHPVQHVEVFAAEHVPLRVVAVLLAAPSRPLPLSRAPKALSGLGQLAHAALTARWWRWEWQVPRTATKKLRIATLGISGGRSLTGPFRDARRFPSTRWYPVPVATRTPSGLGICPSFKDHSLSRRANPNFSHDSQISSGRTMMVELAAQKSSTSRRDLRQRGDSQPQSTLHRAKLSAARAAQYSASSWNLDTNRHSVDSKYDTDKALSGFVPEPPPHPAHTTVQRRNSCES